MLLGMSAASYAGSSAMARRTRRPAPTHQQLLEPCRDRCSHCGGPEHVA